MRSTQKLDKLCQKFKYDLLERGKRVRDNQTLPCPAPIKPKQKLCKHKSKFNSVVKQGYKKQRCQKFYLIVCTTDKYFPNASLFIIIFISYTASKQGPGIIIFTQT